MGANDRQVGGDHYKVSGEQHWDRVARLGLDYFQGQITKYVERWKLKNGIEDLKKAQHFLEKYIEVETGKAMVEGFKRVQGGSAPDTIIASRDAFKFWRSVRGKVGEGEKIPRRKVSTARRKK